MEVLYTTQQCAGILDGGENFMEDVFIVNLINCDMELGIQWLATLGNIISNYKDLWMSFKWHDQDILLKGIDCSKVQTIEMTQLNSLLVDNYLIVTRNYSRNLRDYLPSELMTILFIRRKVLKQSTLDPIDTLGVQKGILKKMVDEMLESEIIQQSNNPFVFPVVLVKKKDGS
jgi:hypothetical protein